MLRQCRPFFNTYFGQDGHDGRPYPIEA